MIDRVDQRHQFPGAFNIAHLGEGHHRPYGAVGILAAIFPHAGQIAANIAWIRAVAVKRRSQQFDQTGLIVDQMFVQ
ncbi:hypothetical protein D3C79_1042510 [compost metagenome]